MKKTELRQEKILKIILQNPGISSVEIAKKLDITRITAYNYLQKLLENEKIFIEGNRKSQRYFPKIKKILQKNFLTQNNINIEELKTEIQEKIFEKYDEKIEWPDIETTFDDYCIYISLDDKVFTGFEAFILWCLDKKHYFANNIVEKAIEYLDIIGSIEFRRDKKTGFFSGKLSAEENLKNFTKIGFNYFYFCAISVLENDFGATRKYLELGFGKKNGNIFLLESAIQNYIKPIKNFIKKERVDGYILTPPTLSRGVQFRDIFEKKLDLDIIKIKAEKVSIIGQILREQKSFKGGEKPDRIRNASQSLEVEIPKNLKNLTHIVIFDDTFTTGATPNAIAVKFREAGFEGIITIITICGSYNYNLTLTEEEI